MHTSKLSYYLVLFFVFHVLGTQAQDVIFVPFGVDENVTYCNDETVTIAIPPHFSSTVEFEIRRIRGGTDEVVRPLDPSHFFPIVTDLGAAANSVQNGDGFYAIAYNTETSTLLVGTSSTTYFEIISVDPGTLSPTLSKTIPYNTSPGLLSGSDGSSTSGTLSYQWQQSTDDITWSDITLATGKTYTPGPITSNTYFRREAITTLPGGDQCSSGSNSILISIPSTFSLTSSAASNTFCVGDILTFTASGSTSYEFLVNGAIVQGPSAVQTYTTVLSEDSVVSINGDTSSKTHSINMYLNEVQAGSISGTQIICYGEAVTMNLVTHGSVGGVSLTLMDTENYQWQSSLDRIYWTDVPGGKSADLTVTSLISSTFFRLNTVNTLNGLYCEAPSNWVEIIVAPDLKGGVIDQSDYILCLEDTPQELTVSDGSSGANILYQWQKSTDGGATYTDILYETNLIYKAAVISETTRFRRKTYSAVGSCTIFSNDIKVTLNDISPGSLDPTQSVIICFNSIPPMISNGATGEDAASSVGTITYQWQQSIDNSNWTDLTSGTLSHYTPTQAISQTTWFRRQGISTIGTLVCSNTTNAIRFLINETQVPSMIRKDIDDEYHNVFQVDNLWFNNTYCQSTTTTSTVFFVCQETTATVTPTYEWKVTPVIAGVMNSASGTILWNPVFTGTATISVRDLNCGGTSEWLDTPIEVVASSIVATLLATPTILTEEICGLIPSEIPECQIETATPNTHFYITTASGTSDYASIEWSLSAIFPGGGISGVVSPGSIDSFTGELNWNPGFWGTLDVVATPVNCDGTQGPPSSLTIKIIEAVDTSPAILVDITTPFPVCPTGGGETSLISSDLPVVWSLNNPSAGVIASTDSYTGALTWDADFSGWVNIIATTSDPCTIGSSEIYVNVPGKASISTLSGGFGNVTLCQGTYLNGIEYSIGGFPTFANVANLPAGITSTFSATHHVVDIVYTGTALNGQVYRLDILGQTYTYAVAGVTETADEVVMGLANEISSFLGARFTATRVAAGTLRLRTNVAGFQLAGTVYSYTGAVEVFNISTISLPERTITLTGTVTADPGIYDYTITTEGGTASCTQVSRVARFTVTGQSSISLDLGSDDNQEICLGETISPITYPVDYASNAVATDLPAGLTQTYSSTSGLIISGTPTENVTQTTVYVYTVQTLSNKGGCSPEATVSGTITIQPQQLISLSSAVGTDDQTICNTGPVAGLVSITYQLSGSTQGYSISGLPPGIGANYDPVSQIITITGSPSEMVTRTTVYPYSITTSGTYCSATTISGTIEVDPQPSITLSSAVGTDAQVGATGICFDDSIQSITYELQNNASVDVSGLPAGVSYSYSGNTLTISGIPNPAIASSTIYTYTVTSTGSDCQPEATTTGRIEVHPLQGITLSSAVGTDNQTICNTGPVAGLVSITYQLSGSTQGYSISGLPAGIGADYDPVTRVITIAGSPSDMVTRTTVYPYSITTSGTYCSATTISGTIEVDPQPSITLSSAVGTDAQVGATGICFDDSIQSITYELQNNASVDVSRLPAGVSYSYSGNTLTISGIPNPAIASSTIYTYTVTSTGSDCQPEATTTGRIEVHPLQGITLSSAVGTDNQTICNTGPVAGLVSITYQLSGSTQGYSISGLPAGIGADYDPVSRIITITGSPSDMVTRTTVYPYSITTSGTYCSATTISGTIEVDPQPSITLSSAVGTDAQVGATGVCFDDSIQSITYELQNNASVDVSGLPAGVSYSYSGNTLTIAGTPNPAIASSTIYTYTVTSTGSDCQPEATTTGKIEVHPQQLISLSSAVGTDDQTICNTGPVAGLVSITYQLSGSTQGYSISGLPAGIGADYDPVSRIITITGSPSDMVTRTTVYPYSITTSGTYCSSVTLNGIITVASGPVIALTSPIATSNQIGGNQICVDSPIVPIIYTIGNTSSVAVTGLPNGVTFSQSGNTITISGAPNVSITEMTRYSYTITTEGSSCKPEVSLSGLIDVSPLPFVDVDYITVNDINHISCNGYSDGSITIPADSPAFDLRIRGGQSAIGQLDRIVLTNQPELGDVYSITVDGNTYEHTVIASGFGGATQTPEQVALALIDEINTGTGVLLSSASASFENPSGINLAALNPEVPFTTGATVLTSYTGIATPTIVSSNVVSHVMLSYSYSWTGPNGFTSSNLSISNLDAGVYNLEVTIGNCSNSSAQASFTIEEPDSIEINTDLCNGAFQATVTGGVAPYSIRLYDGDNNLLQTNSTNSNQNYVGLTPGANYILSVTDSRCDLPKKTAINLPFALTYDASIPAVVDDLCNNGKGEGYIELGTSSGVAFSGGSNQFSYSWSGPDGFGSNKRDIYGLLNGNYTVTVTDNVLGCSDTKTFAIGTVNPLSIDILSSIAINTDGEYEVNLDCANDQNGEIEIQVNGGNSSAGFTYLWSRDGNPIPSETGPKISNIGVGFYEVVVTNNRTSASPDLDLCQITESFSVLAPDAIQVIVNAGTVTQTLCAGDNNAEIRLEILGGTPPFEVRLNSGAAGNYTVIDHNIYTIRDIDPSSSGPNYTVDVEDANGCSPSTSSPIEVRFEGASSVEIRADATEIDCLNGTSGSIVLNVVDGSLNNPSNVQVQWISATSHLFHTWGDHNGVLNDIEIGGDYQVIVSEGNCELFNETVSIRDVSADKLFVREPEILGGGCNGELSQIRLSFEGGTPPYSIRWEQFLSLSQEITATSTSSTSSSTTTSTSISIVTSNQWVVLPQFANNAVASNLDKGTYRAIISDASSSGSSSGCGNGNIVTKNLIIGGGVFELSNFEIINANLCSGQQDNDKDIQFTIINTLPLLNSYTPEIIIDGRVLEISSDQLFNLGGNRYKITGLAPGNHSLNIKTGITSRNTAGTSSSSVVVNNSDNAYEFCEIAYPFVIEEPLPITYDGETNFTLDPCDANEIITIEPSQVSGGTPYEVNGALVYDYQWSFTPSSTTGTGSDEINFVGDTIFNVLVGEYKLIIKDQNGCASEPITFSVTDPVNSVPFSVTGSILTVDPTSSTSETILVKAIAPNCDSISPNGKIGISISGGLRPYTIRWFKEILSPTGTTTETSSFQEVLEAKNSTQLINLESGKYKFEIQSLNDECEGDPESLPKTYYEEIITVPNREDLYVVQGPFIDINLCQRKPGKISIEVFDNQEKGLTFYYNGEVVSIDEDASNPDAGIYTVNIPNPVEQANLLITNAIGCQIAKNIFLTEVGQPSFVFTSPSFQINETVLTREEVSFTNTSATPFYSSEWIFGDGTREVVKTRSSTVSPVHHTYGISGTYLVTLRNYNSTGCYKEVTQSVVVGKGYNILVPNAFSPNNDLINDTFRALFSGFSSVQFNVYDNYGNILYSETLEEADPDNPVGLELVGWDGANATTSSNYIYRFEGFSTSEGVPIIQSGTFILLK